jgi:hypothetical protein
VISVCARKPARSKSPHPGSALYSILMPVPMVRLAHHDRLDLPLVLRLVEGCASFKSFNWAPQPGQKWRYSTGFAGALTRDVAVVGKNTVIVARSRTVFVFSAHMGNFHVLIILKTSK